MSKRGLYWICQIGGWLFFILFNSLLVKLGDEFTVDVAKSLLLLFLLGILISHQYRNVIVRLNWLKKNTLQLIPRVVLAALLFGVALELLHFGLESLFGMKNGRDFDAKVLFYNWFQLSFLFFFWSVIYFLFHYIENYKKAEIENLKWAASINEIELNKLKSQLNPHFMFNAMNSIRALVDENPGKSKDAITQLSNILRNTLQMGKKKVIPFEEEMRVVKDYLALESIRYEERLKTTFNLDPRADQFSVPPLMVQTLVENGIKHGISKLTKGGELIISAAVKNELLHVVISNSGALAPEATSQSGFGIKNTLQRLSLLYGNAAEFNQKEENGMVVTSLLLPSNINQQEFIAENFVP